MDALVAIPLTLALIAGSGFVLNEWSHGALSEMAGLGHHHLADDAAWHCARAASPEMNATAEACRMAGMPHNAMHGGGMMGG